MYYYRVCIINSYKCVNKYEVDVYFYKTGDKKGATDRILQDLDYDDYEINTYKDEVHVDAYGCCEHCTKKIIIKLIDLRDIVGVKSI